jgi:hypothetical protein
MPVLETGAAMRAGSTPAIGTLPLSSTDRMSGYEPEDTRSIRVAETTLIAVERLPVIGFQYI